MDDHEKERLAEKIILLLRVMVPAYPRYQIKGFDSLLFFRVPLLKEGTSEMNRRIWIWFISDFHLFRKSNLLMHNRVSRVRSRVGLVLGGDQSKILEITISIMLAFITLMWRWVAFIPVRDG